MTDKNGGVGGPTPTEDEARRRYMQAELDCVKPSPFDGKVKVQFTGGVASSKHLNITPEQFEAIKKIIVPEPESPVSYSPCLQGKVLIDGAESEFMIPLENDSVGFSQWGAPNEVLWQRVELLDNLSGPAREWWADNRPDEDDAEDDDVVDELIRDGLIEEVECDDFIPDGSELCSRCNKPYGAHYA